MPRSDSISRPVRKTFTRATSPNASGARRVRARMTVEVSLRTRLPPYPAMVQALARAATMSRFDGRLAVCPGMKARAAANQSSPSDDTLSGVFKLTLSKRHPVLLIEPTKRCRPTGRCLTASNITLTQAERLYRGIALNAVGGLRLDLNS